MLQRTSLSPGSSPILPSLRLVQLLSTPTKQQSGIAWSSCPDVTEFECAYLTVPLDVRPPSPPFIPILTSLQYTNPLPNETVSLALRRLPASASVKERRGTLFVNPGTPISVSFYNVCFGAEQWCRWTRWVGN